MNTTRNIQDLFNATAYDNTGDKLGGVKEIFVDDRTGQPTFVEVGHGLFGMSSSIVPLRGHKLAGDDLQLAFSKDRIKDAPDMDVNNALTPADQNEIYRHYGVADIEDTERYDDHRGRVAGGAAGTGAGMDATETGHRTDHVDHTDRHDLTDDNTLVRSEERLNVDTERVEAGEARLRKYVVHDTETVEVPVTREEVRVERTPIDGEAREGVLHRAGIGEDEASVTLHEERVTVNKETVPVEEVSLQKERVHDTERVTEDVRKERIDVDGVETDRNFNGRDKI
ncbi:PRC and DUF2382 domain-containing protein [Corynebacterium epidermidicanis]|uniref:Conserved domain protein, TIGR02271+C111 n=1 Tax=Corynebacterium epidermidicanis TaxID=1050174 RepID=A0A0G3GR18_9CORY|nr:PRC and DUF2382 domain-containing protein [Corynebacterium epidermidicanis]AKK03584.1 conserved domain protein, TIGR02271+C111 [Corynebacterium epidermidicanis]